MRAVLKVRDVQKVLAMRYGRFSISITREPFVIVSKSDPWGFAFAFASPPPPPPPSTNRQRLMVVVSTLASLRLALVSSNMRLEPKRGFATCYRVEREKERKDKTIKTQGLTEINIRGIAHNKARR